jgi:hypothetical protein
MTVVVAFLCTDGVVIGADSMLSSNVGGIPLAHHKGRKVHILSGHQVFAYSGDLGLGDRFRMLAETGSAHIAGKQLPLDYGLLLTQGAMKQFAATQVGKIDLNAVLAFPHNNIAQCCAFMGDRIQPRLLDPHHFYVALGSGRVAAEPFLRFLYEVFCQGRQPPLREAIFLTTWALHYTIETIPGGVSDPIYVGVLETDTANQLVARELSQDDIQEHLVAIQDARRSLRDWRDSLHAPAADADVPPKPEPPAL